MPSPTLAANRPDVLDEVFDGEAVLVNLATGRYFALTPSATTIWRDLASAPIGWQQLRDGALSADETLVADELLAFVHALHEEQLVTVDGALPAPAAETGDPSATAPRFEVFTDMEDLLKLDPIHDIDLDGSGWPAAASA